MTTVLFGSDFEMTCAQCGAALSAPEWSEFEDEQHVLNLWSCTKCGHQFQTKAVVPSIAESVIEIFFPSLLVAEDSKKREQHNATPPS
jgi:NAD-dependent SIR2 family protein deacetylase